MHTPTLRRRGSAVSRMMTMVAAAAIAVGGAMLPVSPVRAQQGEGAPPPKPVMAFEHAGLERMFPAEKDAGLVGALSLLGGRLKELKSFPGLREEMEDIPNEAIDALGMMLSSPMRMAVTIGEINPETNAPTIGVVLSFEMGDEASAMAMDQDVEHIRAMAEMPFEARPSERWATMRELPLPVGPVTYGPRESRDGWRYEVIYGAVEDPDAVAGYLPRSEGEIRRPVARGLLDLEALTPVSQMLGGMLAMFAPQGGQMMAEMREAGLMGEGAIVVEMTAGFTETHGVERYVVRRAGRYADALGLVKTPITAADLAVVPPDATAAQIQKMNVQRTWEDLREQFEQMGVAAQVDQAMQRFRDETGVDFEQDVVGSLGDTVVVYLSDRTGGGSLLSTVAAVRLADPERMGVAMSKVMAAVNDAASGMDLGPGALRLERSDMGRGVSLTSMRLRGLPMPIDPSFAIAGDWLVIGASEPACAVGARQASAGGRGLRDNASFASAWGAWPEGVEPTSLDFVDTPRTLRGGYAALSLLGTALGNFVASPDVAARDPSPVVGAFPEFSSDVRPLMLATWWSGEDLIMEVRADRSTMVNVAGLMGVGDAGSLVMGALFGAGVTAGAMERQRSSGMIYEEAPAGGEQADDDVAY